MRKIVYLLSLCIGILFSSCDVNTQTTDSEPLAAVRIGDWETGKWGYINKEGKIVINPQFNDVGSFSEGLALVEIGKEYGYINKKGEKVISPQFDNAFSFSEEGLALVNIGGKWGYINKTGQIVVSPQFDMAYDFRSDFN